MKANIVILVFSLLSSFCLYGQNEDTEEKVIENAQFFLQKRDNNLRSAKSMQLTKFLENKTNNNQIYIHNLGDNDGWIITEKIEDKLLVLGYSLTGKFNYDKSVPYVKNWLSGSLDSLSLRKNASSIQNAAKEFYRLEPFLKNEKGETISWNQSPYYNYACPMSGTERSVVGCVPTSLGQLMRYWKFPGKSRGRADYKWIYCEKDSLVVRTQHTFGDKAYNWEKMPVSLSDSSSSEEIKEVSELLYDAGLSVKTAYGYENSSVVMNNINEFSKHFNFKAPTAINIYDDVFGHNKTGADSLLFHSQVEDNLENRIPVLVVGYVFGGFHSMICDGYDNEGYYHLNYGWGGQSDGYYHFSENVWCAYQDYLFVDAYVNMTPLKINYSYSVAGYNAVVKPGQTESIKIQIEEDDKSFPLYVKPLLTLKKTNGPTSTLVISYSLDTTNAIVQINYQTPDEEGQYDLTVNFEAGLDILKIADLGLTVDNESISGDIMIASLSTTGNFNYESPSIDLNVKLNDQSATSSFNVKGELISDQGIVEYTSTKSKTSNLTELDFNIPMQDISYGNKQLRVSVDIGNNITETNESNNILTIPVSYNREIPVNEWKTLKSFYNTYSGSTWIRNKGWLTSDPVSTWEGLTVRDGHVVELTNFFNRQEFLHEGWVGGVTEFNTFRTGGFPELGGLSKLESLFFWGTRINTVIPQSLIVMKSLKKLSLVSCGIYGVLPSNIDDLTNLEELRITESSLSGQLPSSIYNLKNLKYLNLSFNAELTGNIDSIGKLQNLTELYLDRTKIGGKFPADIFNLPNLTHFSVASCYFKGAIPLVERPNDKLTFFCVSNEFGNTQTNQLEGEIFKTLVHCKKLYSLRIQDNLFTGTIPTQSMEKANQFILSNNYFEEIEPVTRSSMSIIINQINVENNNLQFQSFENTLDILKENFFQYSTQKAVGTKVNLQAYINQSFTHKFSCTGSSNSYQWYKDGTAFGSPSGNGDLVINNVSVASSGTYVCEITNPLVTKLKLTSAPVIVTSVTYSDLNKNIDGELSIWPNPVSSDMPLTISGLNADCSAIRITDMVGKVVYQEVLNQNEFVQNKEIDTSLFGKGVYLIQLINRNKTVTRKFLVI